MLCVHDDERVDVESVLAMDADGLTHVLILLGADTHSCLRVGDADEASVPSSTRIDKVDGSWNKGVSALWRGNEGSHIP